MIKTTGLEFKRFYSDPDVWTKGAYHEDLEIYVNGNGDNNGDIDLDALNDSDKVRIESGIIFYSDNSDVDFCATFRNWRKKQTTIILMVECPKEKAQILESGIKGLGGRII